MAMKKDVQAVLNKQIDKEFDAAAVYHGMHIYFEKEQLHGFAAWFKKQSGEERSHADKLIGFMLDRGGSPVVPATQAPTTAYASPIEALQGALAHEQANTAGIYDCLTVAHKAGDPATAEMLQWFVKEQVEEEKWAEQYVGMLQKIKTSVGGLYQFDHHVGKAAKGG